MAKNWSNKVNTMFFAVETSAKENVQKVEYESGRVQSWLKNSTAKKKHTFKVLIWNRQEETDFWDWYDNIILSGSQTFLIPNLLTADSLKEYRLTNVPKIEGSYPKDCSLSVEEI